MAQTKTAKVKILNTWYDIKCPEGEEARLKLAVDKLNERMLANKNKTKRLDNYHILLLAALDISHELVLSKTEQENQRLQVNEFINSLENKINKAVEG